LLLKAQVPPVDGILNLNLMAGPYDYTVNIPQPPAQNFLQSLMGIRQLQQMEDQSAIQQQQAAIQQQQAAFAQQMQPLQMQAEQERIKQIQAATGASNQSAAESKYRLDRQKELSSTLEWVSKPENFTVDNLQNAAVRLYDVVPQLLVDSAKMRASIPPEGQLFMDKTSDKLLFASVTGKKDDALKVLDESIAGAENSEKFKQYIPQLQDLRTKIEENPNQVKALIGIAQVAFRGDRGKAVIEQVGELAKTKETEAKTKVEEAKLAPGGEKISNDQQKDINTLTAEAVDARINVAGATDAVNDLLNFAETNPKEFSKGTAASIDKFFTSAFGDATKAQNLRAAVQPFVTKEWVSKAAGLKGSLSEKEGARLDKGAPDVTKAGPEELLNWLRIVQKVELVDADKKDINAAWQQNARSLQAKAPVEFEVAGIKVKPGDSFQQTLTKVQAGYRKKNQEDILADAVRLKRIQDAQKSGRSPAFGRFDVMGAGPQQQQPAYVPPSGVVIKSRK
jgi:hypothetical protein